MASTSSSSAGASSSKSSADHSRDPPPASSDASALRRAKINLTYLALGSSAAVAPASFRTRSFLTTTRYVIRYAIKRLIRYAKYAAVGAVVATLGAGLFGVLGSGVAFFAAPGILAGSSIGIITALVKFGWRHRGNHFRGGYFANMKARAAAGHDGAADEELDAESREAARREENRRRREDVWMRI